MFPIIDRYPWLLSIISKVMERCIYNRVYSIFSAFINKIQHGFLKKRSCVTQLLPVLHDIGKNLNSNKQVDMIYLHFSKAFDSVDHAILHRKLYAHGLRIEDVQRRASLRILRLKRGDLTYVDRLKKLDLLPLSYDREIKDLIFYYKCRYGLIDLDIDGFTPIVSSRTRQGSLMCLQSLTVKQVLLKRRILTELFICGT